jgi:large subunit ribosomal protein L22
MTGPKTNERPGTKAVLRHFHMSASKARQVLDLIRGQDVDRAAEILNGVEREAGRVIAKVLASAVANATHNDGQVADDLYVAACYADEGATMKRWKPRARGRASKIMKRTCHITIVVDRMDEERLERRLVSRQAAGTNRARRVSESQRRADQQGRGRRRDAAREADLAREAEEAELEGEALDETEAIEVDDAVIETTDETVDETDDEATEEATDEATDAEVEAADKSVVADEAPSDEAADEDETQEKSK